MNLLVSLNSKKLDDYLDYANSFIIGLKDYSINYLEFSLDEIENIIKKYPKIEIFISINRNIFNEDLADLENLLIKINQLSIKGILFYDLALVSIIERLNLNIPLVWHQTHMVTNYNTCNYYFKKGVKYAYLSNEITIDERIDISNHTDINLMSMLMGHPIVSHSKRELLSNYFEYNNRKREQDIYKIKTNDSDEYYIKETINGTSIIYSNIVSDVNAFYKLKPFLSYAILDEQLINHDVFIKILKLYNDMLKNDYREEYAKNLCDLIGHDTGFFYKKTIYKVK